MGLDFDVKNFCQNLRATKPPYECPVENCGKIYKSFCGIQFHLYNFDHENPSSNGNGNSTTNQAMPALNKSGKSGKKGRGRWHHRQSRRSPSPPEFMKAAREGLTYAEAQRLVEIDLDGRLHRINICDPLDIIYFDDSEPESKTPEKTTETERLLPKTPKPCEGSKSKHRLREGATPNPPKLPEASFRIISDYNAPDASPRPTAYYRFIEKSVEELDEEVEYDMDEEDCAWLELMNDKRKSENIGLVSPDTFELLMDRLEKESYFQSQSSGKDPNPSIDEDAVCCICNDGECQNSNVILFCDMCNLAVHQECYGVPYIPEGQWLCRRCLQSPSRAVDCVLCPNRGGAFKQTDDSRWAHVVCALWVPEVCFANTVFLEPIDSIENIPPARWRLTCYICKQRSVGACIQCHKANCYTAFHVTCAQQAGLFMKMEAFRESGSGGTSYNVRKTAYCDVHTPIGSDPLEQRDKKISYEPRSPCKSSRCSLQTDDEKNDSAKKAKAKAQSREKMRKARKILAEKRSAVPAVSIPTIPPDRLTKIACLVSMAKKHQFLQRLLGYWTLKRQSRNGVPLLRRLQANHHTRREQVSNQSQHFQKEGESHGSALREELKYWQRLRQDLERARLLVELIRKREKLKREYVKVHQTTLQMRLYPFRVVLQQVLEQLQEKDAGSIFAEPVDLNEVLDYLDYIKQPMDFSTMRKKIQGHCYSNFDDFEFDFNLIISNCMTYNAKDTLFYRAAVRMRDQGGMIIRQARRHTETIGYDPATGIHLKEKPKEKQEGDFNINEDEREGMPLDQQLKYLFNKLEQSATIKHAASRVKRTKYLRIEIMKVRRKIAKEATDKLSISKTSSDSEEPKKKADPPVAPKKKRQRTPETKQKASATPQVMQDADDESEECPQASSDSSSSCASPLPSLKPEPRVGRPPKKVAALQPPLLSTTASSPPVKMRKTRSLSASSSQKTPKTTSLPPPILKPQVPIPQRQEPEPLPPRSCRANKPIVPCDPVDLEDLEKEEDEKDQNIEDSTEEETLRPKMTRSRKRLRSEADFTPAKRVESRDRSERHPLTAVRSPTGNNRHRLLCAGPSLDTSSDSGTDMTSESTPGGGINRRTALFKKKAAAKKEVPKRTSGRIKKSTEATAAPTLDPEPNMFALTIDTTPKEKDTTPKEKVTRRHGRSANVTEQPTSPKRKSPVPNVPAATPLPTLPTFPSSPLPQTDSFKIYRSSNLQEPSESENNSESSSSDESSSSSENESGSETDDSESREESGRGDKESQTSTWSSEDHLRIPLEPLDLVWAKCRGYPWYPALIINPEMPKSGFSQNGVPIPVPPDEVLLLQKNTSGQVYLVLFFDVKRTWQWLPRNKLEPLGVDSALDKAKLVESKKPTERKAVKKAFENAILHRCRVTGETTGISGESSNED